MLQPLTAVRTSMQADPWHEQRAWLGANCPVLAETASTVTVRFVFTGRDASPWPQDVRVALDLREDGAWLVLDALVCALPALRPEQALRHSAGLGVGALVVTEGAYVLSAALPLEALAPQRLGRIAWLMGHEAARLRLACGLAATTRSDAFYELFAE